MILFAGELNLLGSLLSSIILLGGGEDLILRSVLILFGYLGILGVMVRIGLRLTGRFRVRVRFRRF